MTKLENEPKITTKKKALPQYKVLLHNDDVNSFLHVIQSLMEIFKFEGEKAYKVTEEAHKSGIALVIIEPYERAEFHCEQLKSASLVATMEPA